MKKKSLQKVSFWSRNVLLFLFDAAPYIVKTFFFFQTRHRATGRKTALALLPPHIVKTWEIIKNLLLKRETHYSYGTWITTSVRRNRITKFNKLISSVKFNNPSEQYFFLTFMRTATERVVIRRARAWPVVWSWRLHESAPVDRG